VFENPYKKISKEQKCCENKIKDEIVIWNWFKEILKWFYQKVNMLQSETYWNEKHGDKQRAITIINQNLLLRSIE